MACQQELEDGEESAETGEEIQEESLQHEREVSRSETSLPIFAWFSVKEMSFLSLS